VHLIEACLESGVAVTGTLAAVGAIAIREVELRLGFWRV
jgi:hypothetical protein